MIIRIEINDDVSADEVSYIVRQLACVTECQA